MSKRILAAAAIEALELRRMLSTTNTSAPTTNLRDITNGPMAKAGGNLVNLYIQYQTAKTEKKLSTFDSTVAKTSVGQLLDISGQSVGVQVRTTGSLSKFEKQLKADGMVIRSVDAAGGVVAGYLPIGLLHQIALQSNVANINPLSIPVVYQQGVSPNQADTALSAALAKATYGLTGAGIKVGVISNSVNQFAGGLADSVRTGDLPANVDVLSDGTAGDDDEGRAILEQIYDIAPGASLFFASGDGGQQAFASAITSLQAAGCNVIIDDLGYSDEPFFQPGVIDDAINSAVAAGVSYFSAAGNEANDGFLQAANFVQGTLPAQSGGGTGYLINFDPNGSTPQTKMTVKYTGAGDITLEWDDAYNGVTGTVNADLDFYLFNAAGTVVDFSSTDNNFATGVPTEDTELTAGGTYQVEIVAKNTVTADLPRYYEFSSEDDTLSLSNVQYASSGTLTSILGHSGGANTISVGAVNYPSVPSPENSGANIPTEYFTSLGPVLHDRDANGNLLSSAVTLQKPDISATDGNNTSFFGQDTPQTGVADGLPYFYGTSSASGNAAGVAALLLQIDPTLGEAALVSVLKSTAVPVNGQAQGSYNTAGGYGLIDADLAAAALESNSGGGGGGGGGGGPVTPPPLATIDAVTPNPTSQAVNAIEIDFTQAVTGFDLSDLTFALNGGPNLLTGAQSLTTTDNEHYFLTNLAPLDTALGTYTLTLNAANSGITNAAGVALELSASTSFSKIKLLKLPAAPDNLVAQGISVGSIRLTWMDNSNNETNFVVQQSNNNAFTSKVKTYTFAPNTTSYTFGNLPAGTRYYYRVYATDDAGQSDFSNAEGDFTFSRGEVVLDDRSASGVTITGDWTSSTDVGGYYGSDYLQDDDSGKGTKSVTYTPKLAAAGEYFIYARWTRDTNRATKVPVTINSTPTTVLATTTLNERSTGGSGWVLLGEFALHSGSLSSVTISNDTPGVVVADAIQFLPAVAVSAPSNTASASTAKADVSHAVVPAVSTKKEPATSAANLESLVE